MSAIMTGNKAHCKLKQTFEKSKPLLKKYGLCIAVLVAVIVGAAVTPYAAAPVVKLVGFGRLGPIAGSWAARTQSAIGNVEEGSSFAVAQSVGMGGPVPWYGAFLGAIILGLLTSMVYGLVMAFMYCTSHCSKHASSRLTRENGNCIDDERSWIRLSNHDHF